jgi:hypothetical protein
MIRWRSVSGVARLLFGLALALGALQALVQSSRGPVLETDLSIDGGPLTKVTPCSTGRNARFNYHVDTPKGPVEAWATCPSPMQRELAARVGQTVMLKYRNERDLVFMPRLQVYELRVDNGALWTVAETVAQQQSTRWLTVPLAVLALLAGGLLVLLGLRSVSRWRSRTGNTSGA